MDYFFNSSLPPIAKDVAMTMLNNEEESIQKP
jgi:hypothetical protein